MIDLDPESRDRTALDVARRGLAHHHAGRLADAERDYRRALALEPGVAPDRAPRVTRIVAEVWSNLAAVRLLRSEGERARQAADRALRLRPDYPPALNNLGLAFLSLGRLGEAAAALEAALDLAPDYVGAMNNLGMVHLRRGDEERAVAEFGYAVATDPANLDARINLGTVLRQRNAHTAAIAQFRAALELAPDRADIGANIRADLGYSMALAGRHAEARDALLATVDWAAAGQANTSVRLFALNCLPDVSAAEIAHLHREAGQRLETAVPVVRLPARPAGIGRKLRVGYVSPDFGLHPVGRFLLPLLERHDRSRVEIACYAEVPRLDPLGERFRQLADLWRPTVGLSDADLAACIASDGVDLLVDLAGHTAHNRLPVFARRPAPVQASWLGYANTTGLSAIDWRITDAVADPPGVTDALHTERLMRLPDGFLCFGPPAPAPPVSPSPLLANGYVTFGSFNALSKLTPSVIAVWGRLLASIPGARLVVKALGLADVPSRRRLGAALREAGAPPGSVTLLPGLANPAEHLAAYRLMDIALDPFPYNGTTTTCESLFMGVPVITLAGDRHAARVGASLLNRVGFDQLVAGDADGYLAAARALAGDPRALTELRSGLRERLLRSPLCDARRFARAMEAAYAAMMEARA
jgi:predicted O-linked N-acetylglucosamine transferase (SPINDLY family)